MTQGAYNMRKQVESEESDRDEEDGEQIKLQGLIRPSAVVQAPTLCRRDPHCDADAARPGELASSDWRGDVQAEARGQQEALQQQYFSAHA